MVNDRDLEVSRDEVQATTKPAYRSPVLIELDVQETAGGLISGSPENLTYFIS